MIPITRHQRARRNNANAYARFCVETSTHFEEMPTQLVRDAKRVNAESVVLALAERDQVVIVDKSEWKKSKRKSASHKV